MDSFRNIQVATVDCSACGYFAPLINAAHLLGGPHTGAHCGGHLVQSSTTIHPSLLYLYGLAPAPPPAPQSDEAGYQAPYNQRAKEVAEPAHPLPSNVNVPSTDNSLALVHRVNPAPEPAKIRPPQWRKHATQSFYELWWNGKKWNIEPWEKYVANFDNKGKFLTREEHDPFARARKYKDEVPALKATDLPDYPPLKEKARARLIKLGQIVSKQKDRTKKKTTQIAPRQDVKVELAGKIVSTQEAKKLKKEKHDRLVILKKASTDGDAYCWKCRRLGHMASRCKFLEEHGKAKFTVFDHSFNPLPLASAGFYEKMKYRQPDHFAFIIMHVSAVGESLDGVEAFVEFRDHLQSRMWKCLNTRNQEKAATFLFMCCSLDLLTRKVILDYQHCVQVFVSWMFKELTENKLCSPTLKKSENVMKLYADKESTKGVWPSIFKKACQLKIDVEKIKEAYLDAKSV